MDDYENMKDRMEDINHQLKQSLSELKQNDQQMADQIQNIVEQYNLK